MKSQDPFAGHDTRTHADHAVDEADRSEHPSCCGGSATHASGGCHGSGHGHTGPSSWRMVGGLLLLVLLGLFVASSLGLAQTGPRQEPAVPLIPPSAVPGQLASYEGAVMIDVRSRAEYLLLGHAGAALNLPWKRWNDLTGSLDPNPDFVRTIQERFQTDTPIYLICRSGHRSGQAAAALIAAGFQHVWSIEGGMHGGGPEKPGWIAAGLQTTDERHPERWLDALAPR